MASIPECWFCISMNSHGQQHVHSNPYWVVLKQCHKISEQQRCLLSVSHCSESSAGGQYRTNSRSTLTSLGGAQIKALPKRLVDQKKHVGRLLCCLDRSVVRHSVGWSNNDDVYAIDIRRVYWRFSVRNFAAFIRSYSGHQHCRRCLAGCGNYNETPLRRLPSNREQRGL